MTSRSKACRPSLPPAEAAKEALRAARPAWTSLLARSARLRALSLGVPALSIRSTLSLRRSARSKSVAWAWAFSRMAEAARERSAGSSGAAASSPRWRGRPKSLFRARLRAPGKERSVTWAKDGKLSSFMAHMINRRALIVVILFSALLGGCSGVLGEDPRERANEAIVDANDSIAEHNRLFEQARDTYASVKEQIEAGEDPSDERDRITEAKNTLEEARGNLDDARESLGVVQGLDVDRDIKRYASLLSEAMNAQLAAEAKEIEFYDLLEEDPALENNRERALDLLSEIGDGYEKAESAYGEAQDLADSNPNLIENG